MAIPHVPLHGEISPTIAHAAHQEAGLSGHPELPRFRKRVDRFDLSMRLCPPTPWEDIGLLELIGLLDLPDYRSLSAGRWCT